MPKAQSILSFACAATIAICSCVDSRYDLSDIDLTLSTNVDLTLPTSSTGHILLRNIIDLQEEGVLQMRPWGNDGDSIWLISQKGTTHIKPIEVADIEVKDIHVNDFNVYVDRRDIKAASAPRRIRINIDGKETEIKDNVYFYDIPIEKAKESIQNAKTTDISEDVVALEIIDIRPSTITLHVQTADFPEFANAVHFDNMRLTLPYDLHVSNCQIDGRDAVSIKPGLIQLTETIDPVKHNIKKVEISITIDQATTGHDFLFSAEDHTMELTGEFGFQGTFRLDTEELNKEELEKAICKLSDEDRLIISQTGELMESRLIPEQIHFVGETDFEPTIVITHITGDIRHDIGAIDPIQLNNIPDVLNNEDACVDLANPMVFVTATNEMSSTASTNITLSSSTDSEKHETGTLTIEGNNKPNIFCLSPTDDKTYVTDENYRTAQHVQMDNLGNLIKRVPKEINVDVAPIALHCEKMAVGRTYQVNVDYELYAPLTFGEQFTLTYSDTDNDWDLGEVEKMDVDSLILTADVSSSLPMALDFTLEPLDASCSIIKQLSINSVRIGPNARQEPIRLVVKGASGKTIGDALAGKNGVSQLDGIRYKARVHDPEKESEALKHKASIVLENIRVTAKGKFTYDAN